MMSAEVEEVPERQQVQALLEDLVQEHEECAVQVQELSALASAAHQGQPVSSTPVEVQGREESQLGRLPDQERDSIVLPPLSTHTWAAAALQPPPSPRVPESDQAQQVQVQQQVEVQVVLVLRSQVSMPQQRP